MKISEKGIELIKQAEGFRGKAYRCPSGVWTIGYGHTKDVKSGQVIGKVDAEKYLRQDILEAERCINAMMESDGVNLRQGQYDAIVSFAFNVGAEALKKSTLWRKVKADAGDATIPDEFMRWVYAKGNKMQGLVNRREKEVTLWKQ